MRKIVVLDEAAEDIERAREFYDSQQLCATNQVRNSGHKGIDHHKDPSG